MLIFHPICGDDKFFFDFYIILKTCKLAVILFIRVQSHKFTAQLNAALTLKEMSLQMMLLNMQCIQASCGLSIYEVPNS